MMRFLQRPLDTRKFGKHLPSVHIWKEVKLKKQNYWIVISIVPVMHSDGQEILMFGVLRVRWSEAFPQLLCHDLPLLFLSFISKDKARVAWLFQSLTATLPLSQKIWAQLVPATATLDLPRLNLPAWRVIWSSDTDSSYSNWHGRQRSPEKYEFFDWTRKLLRIPLSDIQVS